MAVFQAVGGRRAVFWVTPVLAAWTVWLTYLFGRGLDHQWAGALAAVLLATSPTFLIQSLQPRVDVPVTFWWLAAIVIAGRPGARAAFLAGVAASGALTTRPNLALVVIPFVLYYAAPLLRRPPNRQAAGTLTAFLAPVAATVVLIACLHVSLYGSVLESGYGGLDDLFSLTNVAENLKLYWTWLLEVETPFMLIGLSAAWFATTRRNRTVLPEGRARWMWLATGVSWGTALVYLVYFPFDSWIYLRFLLPCFPGLLVLTFVVIHRTVPVSGRVGVTAALTVFLCTHHVTASQRLGVLNVRNTERRYEQMAQVAGELPEKSVFVSHQHSGSLRYYTGRPILEYGSVPADELEQILGLLRSRGYRSYLVLEEWEEQLFRERFSEAILRPRVFLDT